MRLRATLIGNAREAVEADVRAVARALKRAVATTGKQVQTELRTQARAAGFKDGGRSIANAWRLNVYPQGGVGPRTWRPAAEVTSNMPDVVTTFDKGVVVTAKGGKYLAWPTGYNAQGGRRNAGRRGGLRVTPAQMMQAGKRREAFVLPSKSNPNVRLWCLRITQENRGKRGIKLFVGRGMEVVTGRVKGLQARRRAIAAQGYVPMFFLKRSVMLRKRLSIDQVRAQASGWFAANALAELSGID